MYSQGRGKGPWPHPFTCPLPCRPPGHPVQNVLPSTTSMGPLSRTFPSAKETCSPLWQSPRYLGTLDVCPTVPALGLLPGCSAEGAGLRPRAWLWGFSRGGLSPARLVFAGPQLVQSPEQGGPRGHHPSQLCAEARGRKSGHQTQPDAVSTAWARPPAQHSQPPE
jgi:hypothetical protein